MANPPDAKASYSNVHFSLTNNARCTPQTQAALLLSARYLPGRHRSGPPLSGGWTVHHFPPSIYSSNISGRSFSSIAAPLTIMTKRHAAILTWSPESRQAFTELKTRFTSAPILRHPDPECEFIVEVDASNTGVGAILSQRHGSPAKMYPCAFFSRKLTAAERNYDVGNREFLAMKLALEEWRHWLEGATHPFLVLTDHKNLEYLRSAKRLNPRQARWSLFFTRFRFTVTYRLGTKNTKADALSRQTEEEETVQPNSHDNIIVHEWLQQSEEVWDRAHTHLLHAVRCLEQQANRHRRPNPEYTPGQWVWLSTKDLRLRLPCKKLSPRYVGPFKISRQISPVSFRLELPSNYHISPTFHVSLLKPAGGPSGETEMGARPQTPLPFLVDSEEAYRVHELLDSRRRGGTLQYLVEWEGFGPEERSWVNAGDILAPTLTEEFHRTHPEKLAPRPWRRLLPRVRSCSQGGGGGALLQRRLLYRLPRTTRRSHPLNINHLQLDSSSHHSSYLGLTNHPHLQLIDTHTYKPHTHTDSLRSLDLPRLSFLSVIPVFDFCVLDFGPLPVILIVFCLPRPRIVSPELCLLAACPDPLPGT